MTRWGVDWGGGGWYRMGKERRGPGRDGPGGRQTEKKKSQRCALRPASDGAPRSALLA